MKKIIFIIFCFVLTLSNNLIAEGNSEYVFIKNLSNIKTSAIEIKNNKDTSIKFTKTGSYVQLNGYLHLSGNAFVPENTNFVSATLNGWLKLSSSDGKVTTENKYLSIMTSLWIQPNQYFSQMVYPNTSLSVYKEGQYVGTVYVNNSINISGWANSNFINLNGSSYVNTSIYINEE